MEKPKDKKRSYDNLYDIKIKLYDITTNNGCIKLKNLCHKSNFSISILLRE